MSDPIQSNLDRTKKFVKKHQIAVACAATAVVTWKFTKDVTLRKTTNIVYELGYDAGGRDLQLDILFTFIEDKDLKDELMEFIKDWT
jgi:hypothetical protein